MSLALEILSNNRLISGGKYNNKAVERLVDYISSQTKICPRRFGLPESRDCNNGDNLESCRTCWQQALQQEPGEGE
jgi:hypothetical protein